MDSNGDHVPRAAIRFQGGIAARPAGGLYTDPVIHRSGPDARLAFWRTTGWLAAALCGAMAALGGIQSAIPGLTVSGAAVFVLGSLGLFVVRSMSYEIGPFDLTVRMGPLRRRIPLECIEGVLPAHVRTQTIPRSLDYLAVVYRKNGHPKVAHLYPADPGGFLDALVARAPFLERRGDRLVRTPTLGYSG